MTDRTPHEGGRHTPEDLLGALLAGNCAELLHIMTQALDTDAGLRALATLRTGPLAKIEDRASDAPLRIYRLPSTDPEYGYRDYAAMRVERDGLHPVGALIQGFIEVLTELQSAPGTPQEGATACSECALVLSELSHGLQLRFMARSKAYELLSQAARHLGNLQDVFLGSLHRSPAPESIGEVIVFLAEELKRISVVVTRMFDDTYDNISIEH